MIPNDDQELLDDDKKLSDDDQKLMNDNYAEEKGYYVYPDPEASQVAW
jgi:hypothetical protein